MIRKILILWFTISLAIGALLAGNASARPLPGGCRPHKAITCKRPGRLIPALCVVMVDGKIVEVPCNG